MECPECGEVFEGEPALCPNCDYEIIYETGADKAHEFREIE